MAINLLYKTRTIKTVVREPIAVTTFSYKMRWYKPSKIFNTQWSEKPLYILSAHTKTGCDYFCASAADKAPRTVTYAELYKIVKNGLNYSYFEK